MMILLEETQLEYSYSGVLLVFSHLMGHQALERMTKVLLL